MTPCLATPCRSLSDIKLALVAEHHTLSLALLEATAAGCDTAAAHHARRIAEIDVRLRAIEGAVDGHESVFDAGV